MREPTAEESHIHELERELSAMQVENDSLHSLIDVLERQLQDAHIAEMATRKRLEEA